MPIRTMKWILLLSLAGCAAHTKAPVNASNGAEDRQTHAVATRTPRCETAMQRAIQSGSFTGQWRACGGASSPDECSQYVLIQRGDKICGTWSYVATGDSYSGRVIAVATSATDARRLRICGRPGSETGTACDVGWERINKPLHNCNGKLADMDEKDGACYAEFARTEVDGSEVVGLSQEPWVEACLAGGVGA